MAMFGEKRAVSHMDAATMTIATGGGTRRSSRFMTNSPIYICIKTDKSFLVLFSKKEQLP
jgi:hypothetical protein